MESLKDRAQELQDIMDEFAGAKKNAKVNKLFFIYVLLMVCTRKSTTF